MGVKVKVFSLTGRSGSANGPLAIATVCPMAPGTVGVPYAAGVAASGGTPPYTITIGAGALPAGLSLAGGVISGTPTASGTATFTLHVQDSLGATANKSCSIVISDFSFSESFQRADQPFMAGTNFHCIWDPTNGLAGSALLGTQMASAVNVVGTDHLQITNPLAGSVTPPFYVMPIPVPFGLFGLAQYSQVAFVSSVGATIRFGPCVLADPNSGSCYYMSFDATGQWFVRKMAAGTVLIPTNAGRTFAGGDVAKLRATYSGANTVLTVSKNGVDVISATDSTAPYSSGMPGMFGEGEGGGGNTINVNLFQCGSGQGP